MKNMKPQILLIFVVSMIISSCSQTNTMHQKAIEYSEASNYEQALKIYQEILQKKPGKPLYLNDYGWTLFMADSLEKSIETLESAKEKLGDKNVLLKRSINRNLTLARSYLKARKHLENENPQEALEALSKNKLYRSREMELAYYGMIYEKLGEHEKANERWQKIIDTYGNVNINNKFHKMATERLPQE
jgi:tetratricopeptide (TPR) repeat protein